MKSTASRMYKVPPTTVQEIPTIGPGYYGAAALPKSPNAVVGQANVLIGERLTETVKNKDISPGMYHLSCYDEFIRNRKWEQLMRSANRERMTAAASPTKFPPSRYEAIERDLLATRPILDYTSFRDKSAWGNGSSISRSSRFTPRHERGLNAHPDVYLKKRAGSPAGMGKVAYCGGRMRPASAVPFARSPNKSPKSPKNPREQGKVLIRPKTAAPQGGRCTLACPRNCKRHTEKYSGSQPTSPMSPTAASPGTPGSTAPNGELEEGHQAEVRVSVRTVYEPSTGFEHDFTSIGHKLVQQGNVTKTCFESQISRSPRTNPIAGLSETCRPDCPIGPGYYDI